MWRNKPILELIKWLRNYNDELKLSDNKIGIYGLDIYSLHTSIEEIIKFLDKHDPAAAAKARARYKCLDTAIHDPVIYQSRVQQIIKEEFSKT
jgi:erythromycin esterase-like protein